jgi:chloramphenicol 3-O phosphotransferase
MATVIILNGVSSAGKSSLARALQEHAQEDFLRVAMDDFLSMLPPGRESTEAWFPLVSIGSPEQALPRFETGPRGHLLLEQMRAFVGSLAARGMNVIVDEVCEADAIRDYRLQAGNARLVVIKVEAPLAVIEQRERERGDRLIGLARDQSGFLHKGIAYDITVDTSTGTPDDLARGILARLAA